MAKTTNALKNLIRKNTTKVDLRPITARGLKFVDEYMVDLNATRAAKAAGYANPVLPSEYAVMLEIERRRKVDAAGLKITENRNLREYARIAYFDPRMLFREDGKLKEIKELSDNEAACIAGFDYEEEGADKNYKRTFKYKFSNKLPALEALSKFLGLFPSEKHEHTGKDGGPIEMAEMSNNDKARRLMFVLNAAIKDKKQTTEVNYEDQEKITIATETEK